MQPLTARSQTGQMSKSDDDLAELPTHLENISAPPGPASGVPITNRHSRNPQDWPKWKKELQIWMVSAHSMISTFLAAGIIPAFDQMAEQYGVTVHEASYLTSSQILLLGVAPLLLGPVSTKYGRYPLCVFSVFGSLLCSIGGARCTSFAAQMTTRVLAAVVISPAIGIGGGIVTELASPDERAEKLGYWTLLTVLGAPTGPLIMGFVVDHVGVAWVYWIFAMINFVQLASYLALGDETRYVEGDAVSKHMARGWGRLLPRTIDPTPLTIRQFLAPFMLIRYPGIIVPAIAHSVLFCYANIAIVVEMPIAFGQKFNFSAQQIGLQFIAVIIGCALGEQASGPLSDYFLRVLRRRRGQTCPAERLWLVYIGFVAVWAGLLTWGFQLEKATSWNVTPCVGAAIASFGNQVQTTVLLSFAIDSHREHSTSISVLFNFCRLVFGFFGRFYFPPMFDTMGFGASAGVMCGVIVCFALVPIVIVQVVALRGARRDTRMGSCDEVVL
ncbi:hypothetical protein AFLA70_521g000701 [Aspergillus flavus AF70]|nr:hypothetical protein AFLA70_521g000701 [Aspergillus flavus AF70]